MNRLGKTAAIILATLLVAVTPVVAFADVGPKNELSISESDMLTKVNAMMGDGKEFEESNHGGIVSFAAQMDLKDLIEKLGLKIEPGEKITRGQIIRVLAGSEAGKENKGKSEEAKANRGNSEEARANDTSEDEEDKLTGQARADANRSAATDTDTEDEKDKGEKKDNQGRQNANARGNADLDDEGTDIISDDESVSRGQGQGRGNQNR